MLSQEEAEAWARKQGAVLKVNFAVGDTSLQVGGFVVYRKAEPPFERVLPGLVADLELQMGAGATEELTQPR